MRLTPSWFRSSGAPPKERSEDDDTTSGITIYYPSKDEPPTSEATDGDAEAFVPDSDAALLIDLDEMQTPATVDEVADQLIEPAQPPIETWADVHERLYRDRLPALEAAGEIEFDEAQGIVERTRSRSTSYESARVSPTVIGVLAAGMLFLLIALVSASVLTALTVTFVTATVAAWIVPGYVEHK